MRKCMCVLVPMEARKDSRFPGAGVKGGVNRPVWVLGTELWTGSS